MLRKIFFLPKEKIILVIPVLLALGFVTGLLIDTRPLKALILPTTIFMIYPTMIGINLRELVDLSYGKLILMASAINFILVPLLAYLIGNTFLLGYPQLFAGLAISALLPTGNMTIAFTMLAKGNVAAAVKLTVLSLILGSLVAPWYLLAMVGQYIPIDVAATAKTISLVVFLPLFMGIATYNLILKKLGQEYFLKKVKPTLPAFSSWGMVIIIFVSISMNANRIVNNLEIVWLALFAQVVFYLLNYLVATFTARKFFSRAEGYALIYSVALRNLSISIGLAATAFGADAALIVTMAFLIQQQAAAWFARLNEKYNFLPAREAGKSLV